jgi:type VI secretion system Hcp family effector
MGDDLLHPVPGEHPTGDDLRGGKEWEALVALRRKADWAALRKECTDILQSRSKDLEIALWWTEANSRLDGLLGLVEGIQLVSGFLARFTPEDLHFPAVAQDDPPRPAESGYSHELLTYVADWLERCLLQIQLDDSRYTLTTLLNARLDKELQSEVLGEYPNLYAPWLDLRTLETALDEFVQVIDNQGGAGGTFSRLKRTLADLRSASYRWSQEKRAAAKSDEAPAAAENLTDRETGPQYDIFFRIEGIAGESTDAQHLGWLDCTAYRQSLRRSEPPAGEPQPGFEIEKNLDRASPALYQAVHTGRIFPIVIVEVCRRGDQPERFLKIEMSDAIIAQVQQTASAASGSLRPSEVVLFEYSRIQWTYTKLQVDGLKEGNTSGAWTYARSAPRRGVLT